MSKRLITAAVSAALVLSCYGGVSAQGDKATALSYTLISSDELAHVHQLWTLARTATRRQLQAWYQALEP